jgi:AcrR family transcriptional regulator
MTGKPTGLESDSPPADSPFRQSVELGSPPKRERSDAARNRLQVLAAAERLIAVNGVAALTMDDIAREAGVGKGTLYRRFGDKGGLAMALLGEREREFQERIISGPPPLGPGADPVARLTSFVLSYLELVVSQHDLMLLSETSAPGARLQTGAHSFWLQHCSLLLRQLGSTDPSFRAEIILAALSAEQVAYWLQTEREPSVGAKLSAAALALALPLAEDNRSDDIRAD